MNRRRTLRQVPARTAQSDALSRDLLGRGFKFVGSTICYAFMQAVGMVNDHTSIASDMIASGKQPGEDDEDPGSAMGITNTRFDYRIDRRTFLLASLP